MKSGLVEMCQRQRRLVAPPNAFLRDIADDDAPFKGLLAFEEADEEIFFGREELTAELVAASRTQPTFWPSWARLAAANRR